MSVWPASKVLRLINECIHVQGRETPSLLISKQHHAPRQSRKRNAIGSVCGGAWAWAW